jgi:hypothetical protein
LNNRSMDSVIRPAPRQPSAGAGLVCLTLGALLVGASGCNEPDQNFFVDSGLAIVEAGAPADASVDAAGSDAIATGDAASESPAPPEDAAASDDGDAAAADAATDAAAP